MRAAIGLGANLGDRLATLREAKTRIGRIATILAGSAVWETEPVGGPPQADYLNAALLVEWRGAPVDLLDALSAIEVDLGRIRSVPNAPRTLDLDVLWIEGLAVDEPRLIVPHPRLRERAFALVPMLEVVPDATDPTTGKGYVAPAGAIRRFAPAL